MLLFFLLCGRFLDHAMRRKTRAVAGNLAALKAETAHRFDGMARWCSFPPRRCRRATGCWSGRASASRPTASCSAAVRDRREPGDRRDRARAVAAGAHGLCRQR